MTLWDVLRSLSRWWLAVLLGMVATAVAGLFVIREPGVYFTRTQVVFLAPATWYRNVLAATPESVVVTASVVAKRVVGPDIAIKYGSLDATIIGTTPKREGVWIRAEDQGGQWAPDFDKPIIVVDIVAPSVERVRELQHEAIQSIQYELDRIQRELQPSGRDLITMEVAPSTTGISNVRGNRVRALGMTGLLGALMTLAIVAVLESRHRMRHRRGLL